MERVIVNEGTKVALYDLFEDLQDYTHDNFSNVIDLLIERYGINADTNQDGSIKTTDTSLQVTNGTGTNNYVSIAPGEVLTSGLHYISLTTPTTCSTIGLSNNEHTLYLRHEYSYSAPVDVMSGFAIGLAGGSQKNSRMHDSYSFVWDTDPLTSGVALWSVIVYNNIAQDLVDDKRPSNVLKFKNAVLPNDLLRKSEPNTQTLVGDLSVPELIVAEGAHSFTFTTGTGINTLTGTEATALKTCSHVQNTDTYTSSSTFYVGGPVGTGSEVITLGGDPMIPLNFRIVDIDSATKSPFRDDAYVNSKLALMVKTGLISHDASVTLAWNWDNCTIRPTITEGLVYVDLNPGTTSVAANALVGYHLWCPDWGLDFVITANEVSVSSVTYGMSTLLTVLPYDIGTGRIQSMTNSLGILSSCWIHSNAEKYELVAIPTRGKIAFPQERHENSISYSQVPPAMNMKVEYPLGEILKFQVRAIRLNHATQYKVLTSGSFTKSAGWKSPVYYNNDSERAGAIIQIPDIDSTGATIATATTNAGFRVNINGWNLATDFEIVWSATPNGIDFNNVYTGRLVTSSRTADIAVASMNRYYINVRPLISGQAVASPISAQVMSGGGGQNPQVFTYGFPVELKTYSGTMSTYEGATQSWALSSIISPAVGGVTDQFSENVIGEIITVGGIDYIISDVVGHTRLIIVDQAQNLITTGLTGAFTIGTTKFAREIFKGVLSNGSFDIVIMQVNVEQYAQPGSNFVASSPVLRIYPSAMPSSADTLVLSNKTSATYSQAMDILITDRYGNRIVCIDLFDPATTATSNSIGLSALVTIHYTLSVKNEDGGSIDPPVVGYDVYTGN
jgi:hypothetical protein